MLQVVNLGRIPAVILDNSEGFQNNEQHWGYIIGYNISLKHQDMTLTVGDVTKLVALTAAPRQSLRLPPGVSAVDAGGRCHWSGQHLHPIGWRGPADLWYILLGRLFCQLCPHWICTRTFRKVDDSMGGQTPVAASPPNAQSAKPMFSGPLRPCSLTVNFAKQTIQNVSQCIRLV